MTNEEAIHIIDVAFGVPQAVRRFKEDRTYHEAEIREAKDMAIKALSCSENSNRCDLISREERMTREEAISILSRPRTMKNAPSDILKAHEMAIQALEKTRWIPVSKQLPKENEYIEDVCKYYLIQDEYGDMHVAHLSNVGWIPMDSLKAIGNEIVAWQELPQPYKGESEE